MELLKDSIESSMKDFELEEQEISLSSKQFDQYGVCSYAQSQFAILFQNQKKQKCEKY